MRYLASLLFVLVTFTVPAFGDDWPAEARMQMEAAGARLSSATTTADRVAALREIEAVAAAHPNAPDARLTAVLMSEKAIEEAGPGVMLDALGELAASGQITDVETLAGIAGPLLGTIAKMQENGTLLPSVAIGLDDAISKLNAATAKARLPSVADAISQVSDDPALGAAVTDSLGRLANLAKVARASPDLATMDKKATAEYLDNFLGMLPPGGGPAINGPAFVIFRDSLAWNNEMFGESTKALDLVADAIETGKFDHAAYNRIRDRLEELKKGPWDGDTAKDFFKKLCESIPIAGAWCADAFKATEELITGNTKRTGGVADLSGEWIYLRSGVATIVQEGNLIRMKLTWTPSAVPGPHYEVVAALSGNVMAGTWRLNSTVATSTHMRGGRFEARLSPDGARISVSNTEDDRNNWNSIVLTRRQIAE